MSLCLQKCPRADSSLHHAMQSVVSSAVKEIELMQRCCLNMRQTVYTVSVGVNIFFMLPA